MADEPTEKVAEPAAQVESPVELYIKASGLTPEAAIDKLKTIDYLNTPEGIAKLVENVEAQYGEEIAKRRIAAKPDIVKDLNAGQRRAIRRWASREEAVEDDPMIAEEPRPDHAAEAKAAVEAARKEAGEARAIALTTAQALDFAPRLIRFAQTHEQAASNYDDWQDEVLPLLTSGKPRYQGKEGIAHAHEDVVSRWEKAGQRAGMVRSAAPSPGQTSAVPGPKIEDIKKRFEDAPRDGKLAEAVKMLAEIEGLR